MIQPKQKEVKNNGLLYTRNNSQPVLEMYSQGIIVAANSPGRTGLVYPSSKRRASAK